jgi:Ca2+-binding RTX toxin-like protein
VATGQRSAIDGGEGTDAIHLGGIVDAARIFVSTGDDVIYCSQFVASNATSYATLEFASGDLNDLTFTKLPNGRDLLVTHAGGTIKLVGFKATDPALWFVSFGGGAPQSLGGVLSFSEDFTTTTENITIYGSKTLVLADIAAGSGSDTIYAGDGAKSIVAGAGQDTVYGGTWDQILTGSGVNTVYGGVGNDVITGGGVIDTLNGDDGNDEITTGNGVNTVSGGAGNDIIFGGDTTDTLNGDDGDDEINDLSGVNVINGGAGSDTILSQNIDTGSSTITGGTGADVITVYGVYSNVDGGDDNDTIKVNHLAPLTGAVIEVHGGAGNDDIQVKGDATIYGDDGDDMDHFGNSSVVFAQAGGG